jgi:hypothetical protein
MSHVSQVELVIKNLSVLKDAVNNLDGLTFMEGQKTYKWYGKWVNDYRGETAAVDNGFSPEDFGKSEHAIKVDGADYEIGVVKNPTGAGYRLVYDRFASGERVIAKKYGAGLETIKTQYTQRLTRKHLAKKGFRVTMRTNSKGHLEITGRK